MRARSAWLDFAMERETPPRVLELELLVQLDGVAPKPHVIRRSLPTPKAPHVARAPKTLVDWRLGDRSVVPWGQNRAEQGSLPRDCGTARRAAPAGAGNPRRRPATAGAHVVWERGGWWDSLSIARAEGRQPPLFRAPKSGNPRRGLPYQRFRRSRYVRGLANAAGEE